jgi:hypothetical protein
MVREPDATRQPAPQDNQLMSKHRVLNFKPQLRLEWRGQDGQSETEQSNHSASLSDSITASTRIRYSVHTGAFTSRLPAGWSPFPLQDITTTATGLLCWRDSHPLEWQLASLHLLLHRKGLAPSTPCRSPGALRKPSQNLTKLTPHAHFIARKSISSQRSIVPLDRLWSASRRPF